MLLHFMIVFFFTFYIIAVGSTPVAIQLIYSYLHVPFQYMLSYHSVV